MPPRLAVGVDLVSVPRMRESIEKFGTKFVRRIFTKREIAYCTSSETNAAERFAARFAAKEAALKVLRIESAWMELLPSIEIVRAKGGWCDLVLKGGALAAARHRGVTHWSVSLSHEGDCAIAVVSAEIDGAFAQSAHPPTARKGSGRRRPRTPGRKR
jgi:holo-[acyl-carrier protein] synthase